MTLPPGPSMGERLRSFLVERHPMAGELLEKARWREDDVHYRRNLAYSSTTFAGDGFALVGDAAGFIDPFYSPGLDWMACTASASRRSSSPATKITERYCVPASAPCRFSVVGSWMVKNTRSRSV